MVLVFVEMPAGPAPMVVGTDGNSLGLSTFPSGAFAEVKMKFFEGTVRPFADISSPFFATSKAQGVLDVTSTSN